MSFNRMIIYCKDIERISGKCPRSARYIMAAMRKKLNKEKHQLISVTEFCNYMSLPEEEVLKHLKS